MRRLRGSAALLIGLLLMLLPLTALAQTSVPVADAEVRQIAHKLQCPVCEGQNVADSNSGLAQDMRAVIRTRLTAGETEQQILDYFVAAYGDGILTEPPKAGASLGVWLAPPIILVLGLGVMAIVARGWMRRSGAEPLVPSPDEGVSDELRRYREAAR